MKRMLTFAIIMLTTSMTFGQSKTKATSSVPSDDGARVVQLDEQLANTVADDKANCDKMAADMKAFNARNGAEMRRLGEEGRKRTKEQQAEFHKKYDARIHAAEQKMNAGVTGCIKNPKVQDALKGMQ